MRLQYRLNLDELLELNRSSKYQRLKGGLISASGVGFVVWGAWLFLDSGRDCTVIVLSGLAFILIGIAGPSLAGFGFWSLGWAQEVTLEIQRDGFSYADVKGQAWVPWTFFTRCYATPHLLVLEFGWFDAMAVPKRTCEPAQWDELLALATNGVRGWSENVRGRK
jgi:hypothetical protein